jgi:UDP-glucose 4-epimerase
MNVVVFGGSGFIGSHVADALSHAGYKVTVFDRAKSPYLREGQRMFVGDILDPKAVAKAVAKADYVYHFAGMSDLDGATTKPLETVMQNIVGTVNILDACRLAKVKRLIYASTIYVYSNKGGFYRTSKQSAELYIEEYQRRYGLAYTVLRFGTVYGLRSDERNSVYSYLLQALKHKKINCSGDGNEVREYIHVRDAAALSVKILSKKHENQHVIITGHHPMKFKEFLLIIREILGNKVLIRFDKSTRGIAHYTITPYSFIPKIGYKLTSEEYTDMGQGLLECLNDMNVQAHTQHRRSS